PKAEDKPPDEPKPEEPKAEDKPPEGPKTEEPKAEDKPPEGPKSEEPKAEDKPPDEPKPEEHEAEEPPKPEEPKTGETTQAETEKPSIFENIKTKIENNAKKLGGLFKTNKRIEPIKLNEEKPLPDKPTEQEVFAHALIVNLNKNLEDLNKQIEEANANNKSGDIRDSVKELVSISKKIAENPNMYYGKSRKEVLYTLGLTPTRLEGDGFFAVNANKFIAALERAADKTRKLFGFTTKELRREQATASVDRVFTGHTLFKPTEASKKQAPDAAQRRS
ncbi:MAG: hypothetical protein LBJ09_01015, partial [Clostridiales bacterium]|nr:hypothetical protein [Clostridiales bacterium]